MAPLGLRLIAIYGCLALLVLGTFPLLDFFLSRFGMASETLHVLQAGRGLTLGLLAGVAAAYYFLRAKGFPATVNEGATVPSEKLRGQWLIGLRWLVLGVVILASGCLALSGLVSSALSVYLAGWCLLLAGFNGYCWLGLHNKGIPWCDIKFQLIGDLVLLTLFLSFTGGISNPLGSFYLIHVILSAILLGKRAAYVTAGWSVGLMACLVVVEGVGALPNAGESLALLLGSPKTGRVLAIFITQVATVLAMAYLTGLFAGTLLEHARHNAALAARVQEERSKLDAVVEQMADGLMFIDHQGRTLLMNGTMKSLFGDNLDSAMNIFSYHPPDKHAPVEHLLNELTSNDQLRCHKHKEIQYNGRILETTMAPIRTEGGSVHGVVVMTHDITEQRRLHQQMIRQEKLTVLGKLAGTVAHELNNPLTAIAMFAELIVKHPCPCPDIRDYARTILNNIMSCKRIAEHLLANSPSRQLNRVPVDLGEALEETITLLRPLMKKQGIDLITPPDRLTVTVLADATQLRQAFTNIMMNAIRAVEPQESKTIRLGLEAQGNMVVVAFQDNGPGIPPEHQPSLFEPFFTTYPEGTGLGLAIVKGIVERHHGRVWFESSAGEGTTFFVELPLYEPSAGC